MSRATMTTAPWDVTAEPTSEGYRITATTTVTHKEAASLVLEQGGAIKMADTLFVQAHPNETAGELTSAILVQTLAAKLPKVRRWTEEMAEYEVTPD